MFSVVVPTCNRNDHLSHCLERLKAAVQCAPVPCEVIVTDDSGKGAACELIAKEFSWVRWTRGPQRGPAANRNHGAKEANGAWLVFCDDDCLPEPGLLAAYAEAAQKFPEVQVLEGRTSSPPVSAQPKNTHAPVNEHGGFLWSCNFAIDRRLYEAVGGFDERFPYPCMEDTELKLRLDQLGRQILFVPEAAVFHPWRPWGGWKAMRKYRESVAIYLSIHPEQQREINAAYFARCMARGIRDLFLFPSSIKDSQFLVTFANSFLMFVRMLRWRACL